ncbi:Target of EGR1, member 1 (Nuclear) [Thoreauomyces humboldtii]|nr:Target of EGR1, member 1 (Nuclear) [Thoreauomyces humboldtii]
MTTASNPKVVVLPPKPRPQVPRFNEVTRHNIFSLQKGIHDTLNRAHHIAIDCEFTGLGVDKKTRAPNMDVRYTALREVATSHALVAFGLSVFEAVDPPVTLPDATTQRAYIVHNFNFLMLPTTPFTVDPSSMAFLVENGFDFNRLYADGILFTPGNAEEEKGSMSQMMRKIFIHIASRNVPVIVHNGFLDLLFIYRSLYAELPKLSEVLLADLSAIFPGGLYDTKFISEFVEREKATYLSEREQAALVQDQEGPHIVAHMKEPLESIHTHWKPPVSNSGRPAIPANGKPYCAQYAAHGFCNNGRYCESSHDLDVILDGEIEEAAALREKKRAQKEKRMARNSSTGPDASQAEVLTPSKVPSPAATPSIVEDASAHKRKRNIMDDPAPRPNPVLPATTVVDRPPPPSDGTLFEKYHSACFDAYMTGFIFARQLCEVGPTKTAKEDMCNRLYLMGKPMPLLVQKGQFTKHSPAHLAKRNHRQAALEPRTREVPGNDQSGVAAT